MTDPWSARLSDYLDGELSPEEARTLEAHLATCASCAGELAALRRVVGRLAEATDREPATDLWPDLKRTIEADRIPDGARIGWRVALALAAAALVAASLWWWERSGREQPPAMARDVVAPEPVADRYVEAASAWDHHLAGRELPPEISEVLQAEVAVFDRAITETRQALAAAPGDPDLRAHLAATLRAKVRFLARIEEFAGDAS